VWGKEPDKEVIKKCIEVDLPKILTYFESQIQSKMIASAEDLTASVSSSSSSTSSKYPPLSLVSISIASFFRNAEMARYSIDADKFPLTAALVTQTLNHPVFQQMKKFEDACLKAPIPKHREVLAKLSAPLTPTTCGTSKPRPGPMSKL
jgi:hypothetical protein